MVIRGHRDLLYDPRGHGDIFGWFDLVFDPKKVIRVRSDLIFFTPKVAVIFVIILT